MLVLTVNTKDHDAEFQKILENTNEIELIVNDEIQNYSRDTLEYEKLNTVRWKAFQIRLAMENYLKEEN